MRKFCAIVLCKLLRLIGKAVGKGSSLPGQIALKICPDILRQVQLPPVIIAVTGSNGKTSTVEMIARVLQKAGKKIAYNKEGSNQIEGVTSLILHDCTLSGKCRSEILLIESDERYARYTFRQFQPTHFVITNLYRDQLTRNGHPLWVFEAIRQAIPRDGLLFLNADDPLVSAFGIDHKNTVYFGMDRQNFSTEQNTGVYDDGAYCPVCGGKMVYDFRHYNHIGSYRCTVCGYHRHDPDDRITDADLKNGILTINGKDRIRLAFRSIYNGYNILACYALCSRIGIDPETITESISDYVLKNGRVVEFRLGDAHGTLLTSKHENSVSYDQSLRYIGQQPEPHAVLVLVDAVSRKYFTSETSWLWDINFSQLDVPQTEHVYLLGRYAYDLAVRFSFTSLPPEKFSVHPSIPEGLEEIRKHGHTRLYAVTCFSDRDKLLRRVEKLETEEKQ